MSYTVSKLGRLALKTQSAWGTAESSFSSTDVLECEAPFVPPRAREALLARNADVMNIEFSPSGVHELTNLLASRFQLTVLYRQTASVVGA